MKRQTHLRIPEPLFKTVQAAAVEGGRSVNAEIVFRLERSVRAEKLQSVLQATSEAHGQEVAA